MFFFSKKKPTLRELIPQNHIDIHSHLLPGIDDGAKNSAASLLLIKALQSFGITQIITTPHVIQNIWDNDRKIITRTLAETKAELLNNQINIPFTAAAEYMMDDAFVKLFQSEKLLTLKDNHVLVEMSYINPPMQLYDIIFDLKVAGYTPVLAHPERYLFYHRNTNEYNKLKNAGCLFQLNLLATTGYYGEEITKTADYLLKKGLYDFVGSDVHHTKHIDSFHQKVKIKEIAALKEVMTNNQFFKVSCE